MAYFTKRIANTSDSLCEEFLSLPAARSVSYDCINIGVQRRSQVGQPYASSQTAGKLRITWINDKFADFLSRPCPERLELGC